jgi:hypothetical protein
MKILIDGQKVKKRAGIANAASVSGLLLLLAGVVVQLFRADLVVITTIVMVLGIGTAMVGIYFANRWVRKPRPEESLNQTLKSLGDVYRLYHYPALPCEHVLLTPSGVYVIETINLAGSFSFKNGKWKEKMGFGRALRYIVENHLDNPTQTADDVAHFLKAKLVEKSKAAANVAVRGIVVFTHPAAELTVTNPPVPVVQLDRLRKLVTAPNTTRMPSDAYPAIQEYLDEVSGVSLS